MYTWKLQWGPRALSDTHFNIVKLTKIILPVGNKEEHVANFFRTVQVKMRD